MPVVVVEKGQQCWVVRLLEDALAQKLTSPSDGNRVAHLVSRAAHACCLGKEHRRGPYAYLVRQGVPAD